MTINQSEVVFEPKYLRDWETSRDYFENVVRPEMEFQAVVEWESRQANQD